MNKTASRSSLFLLEMILAILFFSLTTTVYVRVFAAARTEATKSHALTTAVIDAQNLAELFYACGGDTRAILSHLPEARLQKDDNGHDVLTYLDASMTLFTSDGLLHAQILVTDASGQTVYALDLVQYPKDAEGGDG